MQKAFPILTAIACALALYLAREAIPPFAFAAAIAYILNPAVTYFEKFGLPRAASILSVYAAAGAGIYAATAFAIPRLLREVAALARSLSGLPDAFAGLSGRVEVFGGLDSNAMLRGVAGILGGSWEAQLPKLGDGLRNSLASSLSGLVHLALAPILAFYILKDIHLIKSRLLQLVPGEEPLRGNVLEFLGEIDRVVGGFLRGQLLVAAFVGASATVATHLLGLPFPMILGTLAGVSELVPYLGPIVGSVPAVLVALSKSPWLAARTALVFLGIQQVEAYFIGPKLIGDRVGLHPLAVIFSLIVAGKLLGPWGLVMAVPAAGAIVAAVKLWMRILGPKHRGAPGDEERRADAALQ